MGFRRLLERVRARQAEGIVAVPVRSEEPVGDAFVPNEVYLEVRLRQMWLTNERELWREYQPFGTVVTEFLRTGRRVSVPSVLGANELSRRLQVTAADDAIEVGNIRVAGPVPYEGDDVSVLPALFRTRTADWMARSLTVVEDVAVPDRPERHACLVHRTAPHALRDPAPAPSGHVRVRPGRPAGRGRPPAPAGGRRARAVQRARLHADQRRGEEDP
jgi:hypothetical protein